MKSIGISPDGGEPNSIGGAAAGAVVAGAAGEAIGVAAGAPLAGAAGDAIGVADAAADGDAAGVACATSVCPKFPRVAWPDGAATAASPVLAIASILRTPVLSRFNVASLNVVFYGNRLGRFHAR